MTSQEKKKPQCRRDSCCRCLQSICGPKTAICGFVISIWGIIQLGLMGVFCHIRSVALFEDFHVEGEQYEDPEEFYHHLDQTYGQGALNCWFGAAIFIITFAFSGRQLYRNSARERSKSEHLV